MAVRYLTAPVRLLLTGVLVLSGTVAGIGVTAPPAHATPPGAAPGASEHFNDTPAGGVPSGWGVDTSGGTVGVVAVPDQVDRSLRLAKSGATASVTAERRLPTPLSGTVQVEARVRVNQTSGWCNVLYVAGTEGTPAASIAVRDGRFYDAGSGQFAGAVTANRWYAVRAVLRTGARRFDLYVDGQKVLTDAPFRQAAANVGRVSFGIGDGLTGTMHVDTVAVRRTPDPTVDYQVLDQFDETAVGAMASGYERTVTGGTAAVSAVPSQQDRSLQLSKGTAAGQASVVRTFPPQTGTVITQATVRTEETAGTKVALYAQSSTGRTAVSIQFANGVLQASNGSTTQVLVRDVRPGEWYTVRLVLDVEAREYTVFVDGRRFPAVDTARAPTRWSFRDTAAADIGRLTFGVGDTQVGTLLVDKVMVYRNPVDGPVGTVVDVRDHGAAGDGVTNDTAAIQAAIEAVPRGGSVYLGGGVFRSGTVRLKSDMTFYVDHDAMLLGIGDGGAYPYLRAGADKPPFVGGNVGRALIHAHRAERVVIEGGGVIHGNGAHPPWVKTAQHEPPPGVERPAALFLTSGRDVTIRNIHVKDAASWAVVPTEIDGLTVADVDIDSTVPEGRDGLDVIDSDDVLVERVNVTSDDDAICFKSHPTTSAQGTPSDGVDGAVVRLSSVGTSVRANGVKFGTASHGAFRDVVVEDVLVKNARNGGLVITAVDGGVVSNITFRRVTVDQTKRALFVVLGRRVWVDADGVAHPAEDPRWVSGVRFEDVTATRIAEELPSNHLANGSAMSGTRDSAGTTAKLYDVLLSNVRIGLARGGTATPTEPREYAGEYPESTYWTTLRPYGFFFRHADGVRVRASSATVPDPRGRPMTVASDVGGMVTTP